jgi:hypothetical protein
MAASPTNASVDSLTPANGIVANEDGGKLMDVQRREKIRMLVRILEPIEEEVRRVYSEEEDMLSNRSAPSKETEAGQISEEARHNLEVARTALTDAIDHMKLVVGDNGSERSTEAPWPLVSSPSSRR